MKICFSDVIEKSSSSHKPTVFTVRRKMVGIIDCNILVRKRTGRSHIRLRIINIRKKALRKIGNAAGPIIHLHVDIVMVITAPRRAVIARPRALKIGRISALTRGSDQKISAVLIKQGFQIRASFPFFIIFHKTVRCQRKISFITADVKGNRLIKRFVI